MSDNQKLAFHAWLSRRGIASNYAGDGQYEEPRVQLAWEAWTTAVDEMRPRAAVEADRRGRMPSDAELDDLSDEFHGYSGNHTRDGYLIPKFDHIGYARALLSRYSSSQPETGKSVLVENQEVAGRPAAPSGLGFRIEDRAGMRCIVEIGGGVRPASEMECALWDALMSGQPAASAEHATQSMQPSLQPVATAFFTEKGEVAYTGLFDRTLKALEAVKTTRMGISSGSIDLYVAPVAAQAQPCAQDREDAAALRAILTESPEAVSYPSESWTDAYAEWRTVAIAAARAAKGADHD